MAPFHEKLQCPPIINKDNYLGITMIKTGIIY